MRCEGSAAVAAECRYGKGYIRAGSCGCVRQAADDTLVVSSIYFRFSLRLGFASRFVVERSGSRVCVFHPEAFDNGLDVFLLLYVDDTTLLYPRSSSEAAEDLKTALKKEYKMTDLGKAKQFLGLEIARQDSGAITLGQAKYIQTIVKRFGMEDANPAPTPLHDKATLETEPQGEREVDAGHYQSIVGSLSYAATATRPDIAFAVSALSRYSSRPFTSHLTAAKRVLRYRFVGSIDGVSVLKQAFAVGTDTFT